MSDLGVRIEVEGRSLDEAMARMRQFISFDPTALMEDIAALGASQTERRINSEKTAPDGTPWQPNMAGSKILEETGQHLLRSVAWYASADEAVWGAAWEFAHIHQEGAIIAAKNGKVLRFQTPDGWRSKKSVTIPARPFLGISVENRAEIEDLVTDHFGRLAGVMS